MPTTSPSAAETCDVRVAFDHAVTRAALREPDGGARLADAVRALEAAGLTEHGLRAFARGPSTVLLLDRALRTAYVTGPGVHGQAPGYVTGPGTHRREHAPLAHDAGPLTIALASCDPSGHVREAAVRRIAARLAEPRVPPGLVVFLALRTADWVAQVRDRARGALAVLLHADPGRYAPPTALVAELLARRERGDFARQQVVAALTAVHGAAVLDALTSAPDPRLRAFAVRTALAAGRLPLDRLAALATGDPERHCRVPAARSAVREAVWTERLDVLRRLTASADRDVRALALTGMVRAGHPDAAVPHLADPAPLVRATARDAARRTGVDAVRWYRDAVAELAAGVGAGGPVGGLPGGAEVPAGPPDGEGEAAAAGLPGRAEAPGRDRLDGGLPGGAEASAGSPVGEGGAAGGGLQGRAEVPAGGRPAGKGGAAGAGLPGRAEVPAGRPASGLPGRAEVAAEDPPSSRASDTAAAGAVAGLAECGRREDAGLLAALLAHPRHRVRAAALRGLRTLDAVPVGDTVPLLHDRYGAVVREAAAALVTRTGQLPAGLAESLLADTSRTAVRRAGLRLLDERDPVRRLTVLLRATAGPDAGVGRSAADAAARVIQEARPLTWEWRRGPYVPLDPTPEQAAELLALADSAAARLHLGSRRILHEMLAPMAPSTELLRLRHGLPQGARSPLLLVKATFQAQDAAETVARVREVLLAVLPYAAGPAAEWPADDAWPGLLPDWFTARCAPGGPVDDGAAPRWLARWRGPGHEQRAEATAPWRLLDWVDVFAPDGGAGQRGWRWWDAHARSHEGGVRFTVDAHPYGGGGALRHLIEAAGGHDIELP